MGDQTTLPFSADMSWNIANNSEMMNSSTQEPLWRTRLLMTYKINLIAVLVVIMVSMGCSMSLVVVLKHLKRPIGLAIGLCSQFIILPLMAVAFAHALSMRPEEAIGTLVTSTCPGGALSNMFTLWVDGDVSLRYVTFY